MFVIYLCSAMIVASMTNFLPTKLIWNATRSMPIGLYWVQKSSLKRGDIVLVWLPKMARKIAHTRAYLPSNIPALKRIHGLVGDKVCRKNQDIFVNARHIAIARIQDVWGRKMPVWQGCKVLKLHETFLLGDHPHSFDSRYFGPINRTHIIGTAHPLWTR